MRRLRVWVDQLDLIDVAHAGAFGTMGVLILLAAIALAESFHLS